VFEREQAAEKLRKLGFIAGTSLPSERPTFLVATSAAEVGVDLDAEHMVSDLVPWERMVQRLGRVNRRGNVEAVVVVVREPERKPSKNIEKALAKAVQDRDEKEQKAVAKYETEVASAKTWLAPLEHLPEIEGARDASPGAIRDLKLQAMGDKDLAQILLQASTPAPLYPALTRALVDAWSMTSLKEHTGRPVVAPWLRGWIDDEPQTTILWRRFLPVRRGGKVKDGEVESFFEAAPPQVSETLEAPTWQVIGWLESRAASTAKDVGQRGNGVEEQGPVSSDEDEMDIESDDSPDVEPDTVTDEETGGDEASDAAEALSNYSLVAFVLSPAGDLRKRLRLKDLCPVVDKNAEKQRRTMLERLLPGTTIVVDRRLAGLQETGLLDTEVSAQPFTSDGGEPWSGIPFRVRRVVTGSDQAEHGWLEYRRFATDLPLDGEPTAWLVIEKQSQHSATEEGRAQGKLQLLADHTAMVKKRALQIADNLGFPEPYRAVLAAAAELHDDGKKAACWQRAFHAPMGGPFGKTKGPVSSSILDGYRHELGSLPAAVAALTEVLMPEDLRDLTLHLIAAHHGSARPVISTGGCDGAPPSKLAERAQDVALRFARLQKNWGPWGLAWWEALLRAADQQASRDNDKRQEQP